MQQVTSVYQCLEDFDKCLDIIKQFAEFQIRHILRHENHKANMWAQQASGYDVGGWNFHIKREPIRRIVVSGGCQTGQAGSRTSQAGLPTGFFSNRLKLLLIDAKADSSDWRTSIVAYLRDPSGKIDKNVRRGAFEFISNNGKI